MPNGILIIDKPAGWTSMDVCAKVRGIFHEKRVGHGGTLDPMATGVLPVFVGQATRAVEFAENSRKEYVAGLRLGLSTDTQDTTGQTLETRPVTVTRSDVEAALGHFRGTIQQIPPMYSAVKINGQKLYELARRGREVERKPREITIYELELLDETGPGEYRLRCLCSKGTYIRTLCHDLGEILGCGGAMSSLRRTMAGGFRLEDAVTLEDVQSQGESLLLPTRCPLPAGKSASATGIPSRTRPCRTAPTGSTAKTAIFSASPGHRAAFSPPSRISLEGDFVHERKSHCIGLL